MFHFLVAALKHQKTGCLVVEVCTPRSMLVHSVNSLDLVAPFVIRLQVSAASYTMSFEISFQLKLSVQTIRWSYSFSQVAWVLSQTKLFLLVGGVVCWPDPQGFVL